MAKVIYEANDGTQFSSNAEAEFHNMKPIVVSILEEMGVFNEEAIEFVVTHKPAILASVEFGSTKGERESLASELNALKEAALKDGRTDTPFLVANADDISKAYKSLRRKISDLEKMQMTVDRLMEAGASEEIANLVTQYQDDIIAAFKSASPRSNVSPKITERLMEEQQRAKSEREEDERQAASRKLSFKAYKIGLMQDAQKAGMSVADLRALRKQESETGVDDPDPEVGESS